LQAKRVPNESLLASKKLSSKVFKTSPKNVNANKNPHSSPMAFPPFFPNKFRFILETFAAILIFSGDFLHYAGLNSSGIKKNPWGKFFKKLLYLFFFFEAFISFQFFYLQIF